MPQATHAIVIHPAPVPIVPPLQKSTLDIFGGSALGALVVLFVKPLFDWAYARVGQNRAYRYHMADRIRDFRESSAVVESIILIGKADSYPVDTHISKLGIPEHMITDKAVDVKALSIKQAAEALNLSNILTNINRDAASLLASKKADHRAAFDAQLKELQSKLRNLTRDWMVDHPQFKIKSPSNRVKEIMYDDGEKRRGIAYNFAWPLPSDYDRSSVGELLK